MILNVSNTLCIDYNTRKWCKLPYPNHPNGCLNYGKSEGCPPKVPLFERFFDIKKSFYFVIKKFNLEKHFKRMKSLHPQWSDKQCKCCLYWQNKIRKQLKDECNDIINKSPGCVYTLIPEAMGVDVFKTLFKHDIDIKWEAFPIVYKVALIGVRRYPITFNCYI